MKPTSKTSAKLELPKIDSIEALDADIAALEAEIKRKERNRINSFFPAIGPIRRELYPKHMEFFAAGAKYKERLFMAANRVGKSESGAYEVACHLTGIYPPWWVGRRFTEPVEVWACGTTSETTRDIVQAKLLGKIEALGTGMIPGDRIVNTTPRRSGLAGAIESAWIKHVSGKNSVLGMKTYEQGRSSFEGTSKHVIWCDEEPDLDVYTEMLYRTLTTKGVVLTTFTPLQGMSDVVKSFLEPETEEAKEFKWYIQAGWNDVPHIPEEERRALIATTPPYQIKARTEGEPSLGAGAIYPIAESEITCDPFPIPDDWPRAYGFDCGWRKTAAIFGARDPSGIVYLFSEHYQGQGEPASHALAIRGRGEYICGVIDPASLGSSQIDGRNLLDIYRGLGLNLERANNSVESGILKVWQMLVSGQLKVMKNCQNWLSEFRKYHRKDNEKGTVKKVDDHLMDATRYLVMSGLDRMRAVPTKRTTFSTRPAWRGTTSSWMN